MAVDTIVEERDSDAMLAIARFSPPGGYRAMIEDGPGSATLTGPLLADASYPEVLVASARTDGHDLRLVLRPGDGGGRVQLGVERLRPDGEYAVNGGLQQTITAGPDGRATLDVDLGGRVEVNLSPR